ncbi:hypothetical protein Sjap_025276 [Stephania japonica]|uniref:Uncharacterized protein n=1 Tax=Stephania japonica TaxID=461633 RepID=A0AAP0E1B5_9MAGN
MVYLFQSSGVDTEIHRRVRARRRCLAISSEARSEPLALLSLCRYFVFCCIFWLCTHLF